MGGSCGFCTRTLQLEGYAHCRSRCLLFDRVGPICQRAQLSALAGKAERWPMWVLLVFVWLTESVMRLIAHSARWICDYFI